MTRSMTAVATACMIALAIPAGAAKPLGAGLTVQMGEPMQWRSPRGDLVEARYGGLSDGSLDFVKFRTPDGKEYTLPRAMSGSGARYSDERTAVWWEHQGKVRIELPDRNLDLKTRYQGLVPVGRRP